MIINKKKLNEPLLVGVEDGSFEAFPRKPGSSTVLCCVEMTGDKIQDVRLTTIEIDGLDATEKVLKMLEGGSADAILLGGITFAGFNIIDPNVVYRETGVPVIIYSSEEPESGAMLHALKAHFEDWRTRWSIIEGLGNVYKTVTRPGEPPVYFEAVGGSPSWAEEVLKSSAVVCRIPEPVRVAGLIARGISRSSC